VTLHLRTAIALLGAAVGVGWAQARPELIVNGRVLDENSAPVPGVRITLRSPEGGATARASSRSAIARLKFRNLPTS
jgi:hypothetical protein